MFGGPTLKELKRDDLSGVTKLEELTVHANNLERFYPNPELPGQIHLLFQSYHLCPFLCRYDSGTLGDIYPLGCVTLSLRGPFLTNQALASAVVSDVSYPETPMTLKDLHLIGNETVQPFRAAANKRIRFSHCRLRF